MQSKVADGVRIGRANKGIVLKDFGEVDLFVVVGGEEREEES